MERKRDRYWKLNGFGKMREMQQLGRASFVGRPAARVVVIGGGLSGLAAAHRIHELRGRRAGRSRSSCWRPRTGSAGRSGPIGVDGFTLEGGADSFITNKPWGVDLCQRAGAGRPADRDRRRSTGGRSSSARGGSLPVPEGFVLMAPQPARARS